MVVGLVTGLGMMASRGLTGLVLGLVFGFAVGTALSRRARRL